MINLRVIPALEPHIPRRVAHHHRRSAPVGPRLCRGPARILVVHAVENGMHASRRCGSCLRMWPVHGLWVGEGPPGTGPGGAEGQGAAGSEPKLTARQMAQLRGTIMGKDPWQFELVIALWTRDRAILETCG